MITAAIHGVAVSPETYERSNYEGLSAIAAEIAARIEEMNSIRQGAGTDLILRLASLGRIDRGAFTLVVAVLHGRTEALTDSYASRGADTGRKKQTIHYRTRAEIASIRALFPEVADCIERVRESVRHHEDPIAQAQLITQR